jgi:hypothetical protein
VWKQEVKRCTEESHPQWHNYGGRGIQFHEAWLDFPVYVDYIDTVLGPKPNNLVRWTIDRIDNNLNYEPGNLRWATYETQSHNSRNVLAPEDTRKPRGIAHHMITYTAEEEMEIARRYWEVQIPGKRSPRGAVRKIADEYDIKSTDTVVRIARRVRDRSKE